MRDYFQRSYYSLIPDPLLHLELGVELHDLGLVHHQLGVLALCQVPQVHLLHAQQVDIFDNNTL